MTLLAPTLQAFFTQRLITQRNASPHTIASYRDTFRLLLAFAQHHTGKQPHQLDFDDLDAPLIGAFLTHLEHDRHNSARTRNNRLAAVHSLYRYAALERPEHAATIARVMAIPTKRYQRNEISYLDLAEIKALLRTPDRTTWLGRRDHALMLLAIQTGLRVSELTSLRVRDVNLATAAHVRVIGKGRKARSTTLTRETVAVLSQWLKERQGQPQDPCSPPAKDNHSAATPSSCSSPNTPTQQPPTAHHSSPSASPRTPSDTPTRCSCEPRMSTSQPSLSGSAMRAPTPPASTNTPTQPSKTKRSPGPRHSAANQADTDPLTRSSRSWKGCDYADQLANQNPAEQEKPPRAEPNSA
jgi:integrase/recombinase XerD